jgi:hypothetical protein
LAGVSVITGVRGAGLSPGVWSAEAFNVAPNINTNTNNYNNTDEYHQGILMLAKNLFSTFVNQTTNQTMSGKL